MRAAASETRLEDRALCGWRVRSAFALPELPLWAGAEAAQVDLRILEAGVPEQLEGAIPSGRALSIVDDGSVLLNVPGVVRMLIRDGREVAVEVLEPGEDWKLYLLGTTLGVLCHQRGLLPLHASAIGVNGRTVAIAGRSGAGKSTLALHLAGRGHVLQADDVTVLRSAAKGLEVLPALPRMKLWRGSLDAAGVDAATLRRVRQGVEKFYLEPPTAFDLSPSPLQAVILLAETEQPSLARLEPKQALAAVRPHVYRPRPGALLQGRQRLFTQAAELVSSTAVFLLGRPKRFEALPAIAALVEEAARG